MDSRLYDPSSLFIDEVPYKKYFDQLIEVFSSQCEIRIIKKDYSRSIAAGVMNRSSRVAVTIYLQEGSSPIFNPINAEVIKKIWDHFASGATKDLEINRRSL